MNKNIKSKIIILLLLVIIAIGIIFISANKLDKRVNDFFTKIFVEIKQQKPSDDVVTVVIDNKSVSQLAWPWQRDLFSDIFDFLEKEAGAKAIVFNHLILYPDTYYPEQDSIFYQRLKDENKLINSYILLNSGISGDVLPESFIKIFDSKNDINIIDKTTINYPDSYRAVINMPKEFLTNAKTLASSMLIEDTYEIVREYMPVVKFNNKIYPSIALSAYSMYTGQKDFVLYDDKLCSLDDCKTLNIPVYNKKSRDYIANTVYGLFTSINWYKPDNTYYTHKSYSAIDVLLSYYAIKNGREPKLSPELFKDKIIIFGLNADKNVWDRLSETPVLKRQSDMDVHATVISNMISNTFVRQGSVMKVYSIVLLFCLFIIRGFRRIKTNLIYATFFVLLYFLYYCYETMSNVYIPLATPVIALYLTAVFKKLYMLITADKYSELIKHAMGKYVSKDVMKKVVSNLENVDLGGVRTTVTVLFIDIRNFTQISESLSPQVVSSILNDYFKVVEPIITKYNGVINKYIGDGILAIFGEPIKSENHAYNAVKCGSEIINEVKIFKDNLIAKSGPSIDIGIGINTGEVFAGNVGTEQRLEYTVIGDNVNLASRLEAYNQILKTQFLISEYTYEYVKDSVDVVKLSNISIKGKSHPIDIYEVLSVNENVK